MNSLTENSKKKTKFKLIIVKKKKHREAHAGHSTDVNNIKSLPTKLIILVRC